MEVAGKTYLVLIVEDNEFVAEGIRLDLEHDGHRTVTAANVEDGLRLFHENRPQVVLCDLSLKDGANGYELAKTLRGEDLPEEPVLIAHSGYSDLGHRKAARESGFDLFMKKPLDVERFNRSVAVLLERRRDSDSPGSIDSSDLDDIENL